MLAEGTEPASILLRAASKHSASPNSTGFSFRFRAANNDRAAALDCAALKKSCLYLEPGLFEDPKDWEKPIN